MVRRHSDGGSNVLSSAAALAVDDTLQAPMLFSDPEEFPDFGTTALDEVFAVGIRGLAVDD